MSRIKIIAAGGVAGLLIAAALYFFVFSAGGASEEDVLLDAEHEPTPVAVRGKLGPHIVLEDRVFTLVSTLADPRYVKLEIVIEFETFDEEWEHVLNGCVFVPSGGEVSPCQGELQELLHEFEQDEIGTGRKLIEDAVTTLVTARTVEDFSSITGRESLRAEIKEAVTELIYEPRVTRVLFTNLITQ